MVENVGGGDASVRRVGGGREEGGREKLEGWVRVVSRVDSIPRKLYVFLADRMAGTSPEYIMCFPPLGLGY